MTAYTYKTEHYTLRASSRTERGAPPVLHVTLRRTITTNGNAPLVIEATIEFSRLVDWVITQIMCGYILGPYPGVTIIDPPDSNHSTS